MNGELIAPMTYEETMTSDFFEAWFQKFLLPTLTTPSVIIMDNARFHRMGKLELLCDSINVLAIVSYYFRFSLLYIIMDKGQAVKKLQLF
ncbi:IS630-Spn1, transposase Orf2 [Streptococcus pneumoniae]|nr:IS630-Spn1, transposase Orf2 [Streptococcus pneumoniae]